MSPVLFPKKEGVRMRYSDDVVSDGDSEVVDGEWTKLSHPTMPISQSWIPRRPSVSSPSSELSPDLIHHNSSPSAPSLRPHTTSLSSRNRTSILSVASDALSFRRKIGSGSRKKPAFHSSNIIPGVIDIHSSSTTSTTGGSSAHTDYEHEERERLRDVAAQSIGLDPELMHSECHSFLDSPEIPSQPSPLPPFPSTLFALQPFTELSATLPKFTPPSSLLVYALARQWKPRTIVLTSHSPTHKTHVHLFKNASKDEKELERLEVTEDSVIFVAEEAVGGRGNVVKFAGSGVSSKQNESTGEGSLRTMWFLQIKDPAESHRWITAIKDAVLSQRAVRAGLDIPARSDGANEPKGDMDVMLSMHLQRIMSAHPFKISTAASPPIPTSQSPAPSLRSVNISTSSSSPTTTMKGIFSGTRSRSPSVEGSPTLTHPPGHTEDSFSAAGTSLLTMLRTKSSTDSSCSPRSLPLPPPNMPGQRSPAPSLRSATTPAIITASDLKISKERDAPEMSNPIPEATSSSSTPGSTTPPTPSISPQGTSTMFSLQPPPRKCKLAVAPVPASLSPEPQKMYKQSSGNRSVAGNFGISSGNSGDVTPRETSPVSPGSPSFPEGQPGSFSPRFGVSSLVEAEMHVREQRDEATLTMSGNEIVSHSSPGGASGSVPSPTDKPLQGSATIKRWSRQGVPLPKQPTPPSGPPPSIPPSPENNHRISMGSSISISVPYTIDRSPSTSSSNPPARARISPRSGASLSPIFWRRVSSSSTYSAISTSTTESQVRGPLNGDAFRSSFGSIVSNGGSLRPMSLSLHGSSPVVTVGTAKRRSMPPPRPAPNFAPPPAPTGQESISRPAPLTTPVPPPQKSFRSSVAQRALRLSLTSPKPPPLSALPPRPDEETSVQGHRRSSTSGASDFHPTSASSSRPISPLSNSIKRTSPPRSLSIKQRLRILSTPPVQPLSSIPSIQVSTLDLSDDNDDDLPTPYYTSSQPFGLGEHIITMQNDPSFLQLTSPITPTTPKASSRNPFQFGPPLGGLQTPSPERDCDFVALSPPPPRRGSKPHVITVPRPEKLERSGSTRHEESKLVSLGFVTT